MKSKFDLETEIQKAWDFAWTYYCEESRYQVPEYDEEGLPTGKLTGEVRISISPPRQAWLTATDLERRVRAAAQEQLEGKPYGSCGCDSWRSGVRISTGSRLTLLDVCRSWLLRRRTEGVLEAHNFGKGHISGMRFRPVGVSLTESEVKTKEKKERRAKGETPVHFRTTNGNFFTSRPICVGPRKSSGSRPKRSSARLTTDREQVTCPRCLKLLATTPIDSPSKA